jgi:predicted metal-dependent TIM-barrel fold hydrolase
MKFIDPHIHMYSRTTDDYEKMILSGIETIIEPSFWLGQERTSIKTMQDYWDHIINFERKRAAEFGINHFCAISINPKEANDSQLANDGLDVIEDYLIQDSVVALGEIGFDLVTKKEEDIFIKQLLISEKYKIPVIIHTPHVNKLAGTLKTIEIIENLGLDTSKIIIDHNNEDTIEVALSTGAYCGLTVYPNTKLSPFRAVNIMKKFGLEKILVNSSADWGQSDPLSVPKTSIEMRKNGFSENEIEKVLYSNPNNFFKQSKNFKIN